MVRSEYARRLLVHIPAFRIIHEINDIIRLVSHLEADADISRGNQQGRSAPCSSAPGSKQGRRSRDSSIPIQCPPKLLITAQIYIDVNGQVKLPLLLRVYREGTNFSLERASAEEEPPLQAVRKQ